MDEDTFLKQNVTGDTYQASTSNQDGLVNRRKTREDNGSIALRWSRFSHEVEQQLGVKTDIDVGVRSLDDLYVKVSVDKDWYDSKNGLSLVIVTIVMDSIVSTMQKAG